MTREEFEKQLEATGCSPIMQCITDEEYSLIEKVYQFHPSISETNGKVEIAELFSKFGMSVIRDMEPRADVMMRLENELQKNQAAVERVKEQIQEVRSGGEI